MRKGSGDVQDQVADDLRLLDEVGVEKRVVVALYHQPAVLDPVHPVDDEPPKQRALVADDVADFCRAALAEDEDVTALQHRLHARAVARRQHRAAPELRRRERHPERGDQADRDHGGKQAGEECAAHGEEKNGAGPGCPGLPTARHCAATTVSCDAARAVACGEMVGHETVPAVFVQEYQVPPLASCTLTAVVVTGAIVKVTELTFVGVVASRAYWTLVAV